MFILNNEQLVGRVLSKTWVADSTIEVEYIVVSETAKEGARIRNFLMDLGVVQGASNPDMYWITMVQLHMNANVLDPLRKLLPHPSMRRT
jgi:hypothetical protein